MSLPIEWAKARALVHEAGLAALVPSARLALAECDGLVLAEALSPATDLPAFPTSSVDGWAVRGAQPWRVVGRVLAGTVPSGLAEDGTTMEIATGAMVPEGTEAIVRLEHAVHSGDTVTGAAKDQPEWRVPGEEAHAGEELLPAGAQVNPAVIGLAASCGLDTLAVRRRPKVALLIFGDELLTQGAPGSGRVRDALGPSIPAYLERLGAECVSVLGPIEDTLEAHVAALRQALEQGAELVCTTGGTMHGPVDHLHPALAELGASYVVNTVAVRPGFPMLVASVPFGEGTRFVAGLPGNPQSAVVALMSLVAPLLAGMRGEELPGLARAVLGGPVAGRGDFTHLSLVRRDAAHLTPVAHVGSAMLRGLAGACGFAVIPPHGQGLPGQPVDLLELP